MNYVSNNITHRTLILTTQLLRIMHRTHTWYNPRPQCRKHAINLAWQHITGRPIDRIPREHTVQKISTCHLWTQW
jgi:hypothetical protein